MIFPLIVWALFCLGIASTVEANPSKPTIRFIAETIFTGGMFWAVGVFLAWVSRIVWMFGGGALS